jgi:glycerol-3-phosphate dehydrogenase
MVACLARTAAGYGAAMATNVRVDAMVTRAGRVVGVRASDLLRRTGLEIRARHVVLAAGAWTSGAAGQELRVRPSKGVHIVVPRDRIRSGTGLLTRTEKSVLFVIPWGDHWLIGDTDTEWRHDPGRAAASGADVEYLLAKANTMLREPLTRADIEGVFAGLRPLVAARPTGDTARLSREHTVDTSVPGLSVIAGGKYTTYRVMARDLINAAVRDLAGMADGLAGAKPPSQTDRVPLAGAAGYAERWSARQQIAASSGLPASEVGRLLGRYGSDVDDLLALIAARPALGQPVPGSAYLGAEVVYACTHEGAVRLDDVLSRRTRITIETRDRGLAAAPHAARLMAPELGWDEPRTAAEVDHYRQMITAELAGQAQPDDAGAFAAVAAVPDPVSFYPPDPGPGGGAAQLEVPCQPT